MPLSSGGRRNPASLPGTNATGDTGSNIPSYRASACRHATLTSQVWAHREFCGKHTLIKRFYRFIRAITRSQFPPVQVFSIIRTNQIKHIQPIPNLLVYPESENQSRGK